MSGIERHKKRKRLEVIPGVVKVMVIGAARVGKTRLIRAYWEHHQPEAIYHYNGATVYPCTFFDHGVDRALLIFEIPGDLGFFEDHPLHNTDVHIIVWMYAIDDPLSVDILRFIWLPQVADMVHLDRKVCVLVGNKRDLRNDPHVIARLAEEGRNPVTVHEVEDLLSAEPHIEISAHILEAVNDVFYIVFHMFLHPLVADI